MVGTAHLNVNVASLLTKHGEEPAQVSSGIQSQAAVGESVVGVLHVVCPIRRQRRASGCHNPDLSKT